MIRFIIIFYLSSFTLAVTPEEKDAATLKYYYQNYGKGFYEFSYQTSNGIKRSEIGRLVNAGQDDEYVAVKGQYAYIDPDGKTRFTGYTADRTGYHVNFNDQEESDEFSTEDQDDFFSIPELESVNPQVLASLLGG